MARGLRVLQEVPTEFRHAEMFYEASGRTCKVLILPDTPDLEPLEILRTMLNHWDMPVPTLTVTAHSGNEASLTQDQKDQVSKKMKEDPLNANLDDHPWALTFDSMCVENQRKWLAKAMGEKVDKDAPPSSDSLSDIERARAKELFQASITELTSGVCRAVVESGGWLRCTQPYYNGGMSCAGPLIQGSSRFFEEMPEKTNKLTFLSTWSSSSESEIAKLPEYQMSPERPSVAMCPDPSKWSSMIDLLTKQSVPLGSPITQQLVYPSLPKFEFTIGDQRYERSFHYDEKTKKLYRVNETINPNLTHIIIGRRNVLQAFNQFLEVTFASAEIILGGKDRAGVQQTLARGARGSHIIVMNHTGKFADQISQQVRYCKKQDKTTPPPDTPDVRLPQSDELLGRFMVLDGLTDPADKVVDKLSKAMGSLGNENRREFKFAEDEVKRIIGAWSMVMGFRFNARKEFRRARLLHYIIVLVSLLTTVASVVSSAGSLKEKQGESEMDAARVPMVDQHVELPMAWSILFSSMCVIMPLFSTFMMSVNSRLNPAGKFRALLRADVAVESEIYRYRTRTGEYDMSAQSEITQMLADAEMAAQIKEATFGEKSDRQRASDSDAEIAPSELSGSSRSRTSPPRKKGRREEVKGNKSKGKAPRQLFMEQLQYIQAELMNGEIKTGALDTHSTAEVRELEQSFYNERTSAPKASQYGSDEQPERFALLEKDMEVQHTGPTISSDKFALTGGLLAEDDLVADDGVGVVPAEEYVKFRVGPMRADFQKESVFLSRQTMFVQLLLYISTLVAAVLPVIGCKLWIPVPVAVGAAIESISQFEHWPTRLAASNAALSQLQNVMLMWNSLSRTQRRQTSVRNTIVMLTETVVQAKITAWSAVPGARKANETHNEEEDGKDA